MNGILEALRASGANWWHIVTNAVIPSTASFFIVVDISAF